MALSPGDMEHFENAAVTEQMLNGLSLYELRLLRNEFYARHGRQFKTDWLAQYFAGQPWYEPREETKEPELSPMETKNVETIVRYEKQLKEGLATKPVSDAGIPVRGRRTQVRTRFMPVTAGYLGQVAK